MLHQTFSTAKTRRVRFAMDQQHHESSTTNNISRHEDEDGDVLLQKTPPPSIFSPELTLDHKSEVWYQSSDLETFRNEVHFLVHYGTQGERKELARYTAKRSQTKKRAIKQILMAQSQVCGKDPWLMGRVSECASFNARYGALKQAHADYCDAYYCEEEDSTSTTKEDDFAAARTPSKTTPIVPLLKMVDMRRQHEDRKRRHYVLDDRPTSRVRQNTARTAASSPFHRLFAPVPNPIQPIIDLAGGFLC